MPIGGPFQKWELLIRYRILSIDSYLMLPAHRDQYRPLLLCPLIILVVLWVAMDYIFDPNAIQ